MTWIRQCSAAFKTPQYLGGPRVLDPLAAKVLKNAKIQGTERKRETKRANSR